jgi:energy-coupling factor transporter ATP-binding protein EcfA2
MAALLSTESLRKEYRRAFAPPSFVLTAELNFDQPLIVGVLGPNGSGKTTLFELITGSNVPTAGRVRVAGQDIHRVRRRERGQLARHYHQSYQVRGLLTPRRCSARGAKMLVHPSDEPQLNRRTVHRIVLCFFGNCGDVTRLRLPASNDAGSSTCCELPRASSSSRTVRYDSAVSTARGRRGRDYLAPDRRQRRASRREKGRAVPVHAGGFPGHVHGPQFFGLFFLLISHLAL